jgi:hypothetical protein
MRLQPSKQVSMTKLAAFENVRQRLPVRYCEPIDATGLRAMSSEDAIHTEKRAKSCVFSIRITFVLDLTHFSKIFAVAGQISTETSGSRVMSLNLAHFRLSFAIGINTVTGIPSPEELKKLI